MSNEKVQTAFKDIQAYIDSLEKKLKDHETKLAEVETTTSAIEEERTAAVAKLKQMEKEMSELSSVYEEMKGQKDVEINQNLWDIAERIASIKEPEMALAA